MTETIIRLFANEAQAGAAADALLAGGFLAESVYLTVPLADGSDSRDAAAERIMKGYVLKAQALVLAEGVIKGGGVVTVHAPFGAAVMAIETLERFDPIESGLDNPGYYTPTWDEAAPLSSALMMNVLSDDPTPMSKIMGLPPLTTGRASFSRAIGMPELITDNPHRFMFGLPLLIKDPAPLSSLFKIPTLVK